MHKPLLILFYFLLFGAQRSEAQKIRFTDTSNEWIYYYWNPFSGNLPATILRYYYSGDSTIKNTRYLRLNGVGFVREDTSMQRVYCINFGDTLERVLFDFSVKPGDTITKIGCPVTVAYITSLNINGVSHKLFQMDNSISDVIEGIGSYPEPFQIICSHPDMWGHFSCFKNKGMVVNIPDPGNPMQNMVDAQSCTLATSTVIKPNNTLSIIPNPANETSVIRLPYNMHSAKMVITNALGQTVLQKEIANKTELPIGDLRLPGIYFYRLTNKEANQTFTGKFIYQ